MTHHHNPTRVAITIDIYDPSLLTVFTWARRSGHQLTQQLWDHGILAHLISVQIDPHHTPNR